METSKCRCLVRAHALHLFPCTYSAKAPLPSGIPVCKGTVTATWRTSVTKWKPKEHSEALVWQVCPFVSSTVKLKNISPSLPSGLQQTSVSLKGGAESFTLSSFSCNLFFKLSCSIMELFKMQLYWGLYFSFKKLLSKSNYVNASFKRKLTFGTCNSSPPP